MTTILEQAKGIESLYKRYKKFDIQNRKSERVIEICIEDAKELLVKAEESCGKSMFETCPRCKELREILKRIVG